MMFRIMMFILVLLSFAGFPIGASWCADETGVCHCNGDRISCNLTGESLPRFRFDDGRTNWDSVHLYCYGQRSKITLHRSMFEANFVVLKFSFYFSPVCEFEIPSDLLSNVITNDENQYHITLSMSGNDVNMATLPHVAATTWLWLENVGRLRETFGPASQRFVTNLGLIFQHPSTVRNDLLWKMRNLRWVFIDNVEILPKRFFWRLPNLSWLAIRRVTRIEQFAFTELGQLSELSIGDSTAVREIAPMAFQSIMSIDLLQISVTMDAIEKFAFSNVSSIHELNLKVRGTLACVNSAIPCQFSCDLESTKVYSLKIYTDFVPDFPDSLTRSHPSEVFLGIAQKQTNVPTWHKSSLFPNFLNLTHFYLSAERNLHFTVNFSLWTVDKIEIGGHGDTITDDSWLTLPSRTKSLALGDRTMFPLVLRDTSLELSVNINRFGISNGLNCTCSISWMQQWLNCGQINVDKSFFQQPCLNLNMKVGDFLASTKCCASVASPTIGNIPIIDPDYISEIPEHLFYFNHSDLPQCRRSKEWKFDPCDVHSFFIDKSSNHSSDLLTTNNPDEPACNSNKLLYILFLIPVAIVGAIIISVCIFRCLRVKRSRCTSAQLTGLYESQSCHMQLN